MTNLLRKAVALVVIAGSATAFTACSSDSSSDQSASTCSALQKLQSSINSLKDINVAQQGTDGVKSALDDVKSAAQDAKKEASKQFSSEIDAVEKSIQTFGDDISNGKGSQSVVDYLSKLGEDITAIGDAFDQLGTTADQQLKNCDLKSSN